METIEIDTTTETGIAAYEPIRAQLATMKETNANAVFAYETPKGNAAARSHIFGIRKVRAALESARKEAKAFFLEQGRKVDIEAKGIEAEIDAMIAVHEAPLLEIEQREKARVAAIRVRIAEIADYQSMGEQNPSDTLRTALAVLTGYTVDESFAEFKVEATGQHALSVRHLTNALAAAEKREAEEAELARLRAEQAAREQKEREDRIAKEAAEKARVEAERVAAAAADKAERDRIAAAKQAEADKAAAVKAEQDRQAAETARIERECLAREADKRHRAEVIGAAEEALGGFIGATAARDAIDAIIAGRVPNVKVVF